MDDQTNTAAPANATPDWVALARDAFSASTNWFDASVRQQIEGDLRQFQGQHPAGSKYLAEANKGRSKLFRPKTRTTIRKNEAAAAQAFFASNDVVKVGAQDEDDPQQAASAAVMGALLQYRLTKSIPWFLTLVGAYQDAQTTGVVASYQHWRYNEKKGVDQPAIRLVPVENLRIDPGADWTDPVNTSPYVIELIPMYVKDVKARMRTPDPKTGEAKWKTLADSAIQGATKTYGDSIRLQREAPRQDSKYQQQANGNFNVVWVHKNIIEVDEVDYVYYTLGCEHILSDPVPLDQVYFHGRRPYVIGSCVLEAHKLYPSSVPRLTKDVQAEINEVANQRIDNVKLAMNKRYFARRNKQVDLRSVTRNVPGSVTLVQDIDDVKVVEFNDVTGSSYKEQEVLNLDFDDVAGTFSGSSVQSNRKLNETVGGMQMLDAGANQVSGYQLRTFVETWVEPVLRQLVLLEQYYETDDAIIALAGKAANLFQRFGIDQITDEHLMNEFTVNVNVGMGAVNPADQVRQFVDGMTALGNMLANEGLVQLGLNVEEIVKELFGKLGYKDGARFFHFDGSDPRITQLQQQVQQLQQQLAQKADPALIAAQIRKIDAEVASIGVKDKVQAAEAVKKGSEAQFSAMQTAEVIAAVPGVAPIADELMKAAGYRPPTPTGIDPNFPQPAAPAAGLSVQDVTNRRTGVGFVPGQSPSTTNMPNPPLPATPGTGQRHGIETVRPDSVIGQAAYANGGLIGGYGAGLDPEDRLDLLDRMRIQADNRRLYGAEMGLKSPDPFGLVLSGFTDATNADPTTRYKPFADGGLVDTDNPLRQAWNGATTAVSNGVQQVASLPGRALDAYDRLSNEYPKTKLFLDVAPGTNLVTSALDVASDLHKGEYGTAALDAVGLLPGYKLAKAPIHTAAQRAMAKLSKEAPNIDMAVNALPEYLEKTSGTPPQQQQQQPQITESRYANGGPIQGPGTGTSDSIPATIDGSQPARLSNGEYVIPAAVVDALGQDFFDHIVQQLHMPAQGQPGEPADMEPVGLQGGDYVIPADVVKQLGRDFFDKLVETYNA
jgi:hypothetical protein